MNERDLQANVEDAARKLGWLVYHTWNAMHSARGFPDLVATRGGRVVIAELKSETGQLSDWQQQWADALRACPGVEYALWRPADWHSGVIVEALR